MGADLGALLDPPEVARWDAGERPLAVRAVVGVGGGRRGPPGARAAAGAGRVADWLAGVRVACAAAWSAGEVAAEVPSEVWERVGGTRPPS